MFSPTYVKNFAAVLAFSFLVSCIGGGGGNNNGDTSDVAPPNAPTTPSFRYTKSFTWADIAANKYLFPAAFPIFESDTTDIVIGVNFYHTGPNPLNGEDDPLLIKAVGSGGAALSVLSSDNGGTTHAREIVFGDFDGNDEVDVFIADHGWDTQPFPGNENQLFLQSNGQLTSASSRLPNEDNFSHGASVGDVNQDGIDDIFIINLLTDPDALLLGAASGVFQRVSLPASLTDQTQRDYLSAHIADLFDDGSPEILLGAWRTQDRARSEAVHVLGYDGTSETLSLASEFGSCTLAIFCLIQDVKTGDFNGDGRLDIVTLESQADYSDGMAISLYLQDAQNNFTKQTGSFPNFDTTQRWSKFLYVMDWDCDNDMDIVVDQMPSRGDNVYLNDGNGVFLPLTTTSEFQEWSEVTVDPVNKSVFVVWRRDTVNVELFAQGMMCN